MNSKKAKELRKTLEIYLRVNNLELTEEQKRKMYKMCKSKYKGGDICIG